MYQLGYHWNDFHETGCWDLCENFTKSQMWLKSDKTIGHITWKIKHIYIVQSITKYSVDWQQCKENTSPHCHCNIQQFAIVDSDKCFNNEKENMVAFSRQYLQFCLSYYFTVGLWTKLQLFMIQIGKEPFWCWSPSRASDLSVRPEHLQECYHRCLLSGPYSNFYWCDTSRHTFCVQNFYSHRTIIFLPCLRKKVFKTLLWLSNLWHSHLKNNLCVSRGVIY